MHFVVARSLRQSHGCRGTLYCVRALTAQAEYVQVPKYPPIINSSKEQLEKEKWHSKITNLPTYEQKLMEINMPKAHGYWSCILKDDEFQINGLPFLKFVTRTNVSEEDFPYRYYDDVSQAAAVAAERLVPDVERLILLHHQHKMTKSDGCHSTSQQLEASFVRGLHRLLSSCLPFPLQAKVTHNPRVLGGWFVGGIDNVGADRPEWKHLKKEEREKKLWVRNLWMDREEPYMGDRVIRSFSTPSLVVRERHGLPPVQSQHAAPETAVSVLATSSDAEAASDLVDDGRRDPEAYGYEQKHMPFMMNAGYWPGESCRHGRLYYHSLGPVSALPWPHHRHSFLLQKLLIACHTQALSQAAIFGFTPISELTYPVVQQSLVTDGQTYYMTLHQVNTLALHGHNTTSNPCSNFLWVAQPQRLWEKVEGQVVRGLNMQLLTQLTATYMKNTVANSDPSPYLADYKYLWKHPAIPWYRQLFHHKMTVFKSERFWVPYKPELMAWEKIYKLDFNTMPRINNNKRFFEGHRFRLLPQDRTCRHIVPPSIKVADRPLGKKDPIKREPMIDSEKLFDKRVKSWQNWRYHPAYTYVMKP